MTLPWSLLAAFAAGALGSGHCALMCGGIATAIGAGRPPPGGPPGPSDRLRRAWLAHAGRLGGYAAFGAAAGSLGLVPAVLAGAGAPAFAQSVAALRLAAALLVMVIGMHLAGIRGGWLRAPERWGGALWRWVAPWVGAVLPARALPRALAMGGLWACMPCGLVYTVYLAAAVSGGPATGAALAASFGLGTLPALLGLGWFGARFGATRAAVSRVVGAGLIVAGVLTAVPPLALLTRGGAPLNPVVMAYCRALF